MRARGIRTSTSLGKRCLSPPARGDMLICQRVRGEPRAPSPRLRFTTPERPAAAPRCSARRPSSKRSIGLARHRAGASDRVTRCSEGLPNRWSICHDAVVTLRWESRPLGAFVLESAGTGRACTKWMPRARARCQHQRFLALVVGTCLSSGLLVPTRSARSATGRTTSRNSGSPRWQEGRIVFRSWRRRRTSARSRLPKSVCGPTFGGPFQRTGGNRFGDP